MYSFRDEPGLAKRLRSVADLRRVSPSWMMREYVYDGLDKDEKRLKRLKSGVKSGDFGKRLSNS